jgi:acyl-CoA reductase-like NAD-dependent aldehyde dehydrogenase
LSPTWKSPACGGASGSNNVRSSDLEHARKVASQMRAGNVHINYPMGDTAAPFGGYKHVFRFGPCGGFHSF